MLMAERIDGLLRIRRGSGGCRRGLNRVAGIEDGGKQMNMFRADVNGQSRPKQIQQFKTAGNVPLLQCRKKIRKERVHF